MVDVPAGMPDQERLKSYVRVAANCAELFQTVSGGRELPVPDSDRVIDMSMERNRAQLRRAMLQQLQSRFANESRDLERWERRIDACEISYVRGEDRENDFDAAAADLCGCFLSVNMLARLYYERYTDCAPLFTVIRRLTELGPSALIAIFGQTLPDELRLAWPHFTALYEVHSRHH